VVTDVLGLIDVLIKFWGQKVKGQGRINDSLESTAINFTIIIGIILTTTNHRNGLLVAMFLVNSWNRYLLSLQVMTQETA